MCSLLVLRLWLTLIGLLISYKMASIVSNEHTSLLQVIEKLQVTLELGGLALVVALPVPQQRNLSLHLRVLSTHFFISLVVSHLLVMSPALLGPNRHH